MTLSDLFNKQPADNGCKGFGFHKVEEDDC